MSHPLDAGLSLNPWRTCRPLGILCEAAPHCLLEFIAVIIVVGPAFGMSVLVVGDRRRKLHGATSNGIGADHNFKLFVATILFAIAFRLLRKFVFSVVVEHGVGGYGLHRFLSLEFWVCQRRFLHANVRSSLTKLMAVLHALASVMVIRLRVCPALSVASSDLTVHGLMLNGCSKVDVCRRVAVSRTGRACCD
jgi:hypothetical protein